MTRNVTCTTVFLTFSLILAILPTSVFAQAASADQDQTWDTRGIHRELAAQKADRLQKAWDALARDAASAGLVTVTNYDVELYDIYIRVDDTADWLYGWVRFVATAVDPSVSSVEVDLLSNMIVDSIVAPAGALVYSRAGSVVTVTLDHTYTGGEQIEFTFYYNGRPITSGLQSFDFGTHGGLPMIASLSEPYGARNWWPCKDRMDDKADSFFIAIEVDTNLYVAANGSLDSTVQGSATSHIFYYTERYPLVTYLFSLAIYPYAVWHQDYPYNDDQDTMLITHAVYPDRLANSQLDTTYGGTPNVLRTLANSYGEYPFVDEKYGHANFNWGGGMEHQTMTSMVGWSNFGFDERVIIHEAAHQWFGDMITCKSWQDIWLNEGWASYSEALFYLENGGWTQYHSYMNTMKYFGSGTVYVDDTTSVNRIFSGSLSYDKGAWVVHMLRGVLGDSLFQVGIDAYTNSQYRFGAATTEEFKNVFESATGQELDWFFDEWIYGEYYPQYVYQITAKHSGFGNYYDVYLWVGQNQSLDRQTFTMPVDVFIDYVLIADDTVTVWVDEREEMFRFFKPSWVNSANLDPNQWILRSATAQTWTLHIVTAQEDISDAEQYIQYVDTVVALGGVSSKVYSISSGQLPPGMSLDSTGVISGASTDSGSFTFAVYVDDTGSNYEDEMEFTIDVAGRTLVAGDIDFLDGLVDIGDLTYLIGYLYIDGPIPAVPNLADVNADCLVDIGDLTDLILYLYLEGSDPVIGCVN